MTDKQTRMFIERKYAIIKKNETKDLRDKISINYQIKEHLMDNFKKKIKKDLEKLCEKNGLELPNDSVFSFYSGRINKIENKEINEDIKKIEDRLDMEKLQLIDEISILGIKDITIKEKLSKLLEIKED